MTSSLLTKVVLASIALALLSGCIADNPEDTNLPWSSNQGWEGMAPMAPTMMNRYD
jgi:type IV pilus biogenesis protein CpaD/CtpE